jgi:hypothetical protein
MADAGEWVKVGFAGNEPEAELLCSLLRSEGIECLSRLTNQGAGAGDGLGMTGAHEIVVAAHNADNARELLKAPE